MITNENYIHYKIGNILIYFGEDIFLVGIGRDVIRRGMPSNVLFNDALNTFYLRLYGVRHMVKDHSDSEKGNPLPHIGYSYRLAARVLLYAPSHRQDNIYHSLCYTSRGALAGTRNSSMGPTTHRTMSERSTSELRPAPIIK